MNYEQGFGIYCGKILEPVELNEIWKILSGINYKFK